MLESRVVTLWTFQLSIMPWRNFIIILQTNASEVDFARTCLHSFYYTLWIDAFFLCTMIPSFFFLRSTRTGRSAVFKTKRKRIFFFFYASGSQLIYIRCCKNTARTTKHRLVFLVLRITSVDIVFLLLSGHIAPILFVCFSKVVADFFVRWRLGVCSSLFAIVASHAAVARNQFSTWCHRSPSYFAYFYVTGDLFVWPINLL